MMFGHYKNIVSALLEMNRRYKTYLALFYDVCALSLSIIAMLLLRDTPLSTIFTSTYAFAISAVVVVSVLAFMALGLYRLVLRSIGEGVYKLIVTGCLLSTLLWTSVSGLLAEVDIRASIILFVLLLMSVGLPRLFIKNLVFTVNNKVRRNVLIFGAGEAGTQLSSAIKHGLDYQIIGFIDENKELQGSVINSYKVYGVAEIESLIEQYNVERILLAIPSVPRSRRYQIVRSLEKYPVDIKTVTSLDDIVSGKAKLEELRDIEIDDILGREKVAPIKQLLHAHNLDKNVLITGAGGSIGSELARQVCELSPKRLVLLDVSEYNLYKIEQELTTFLARGGQLEIIPLLGSILDEELLDSIFQRFNINTVYHAAAYKHVPMVESNVSQGFANNVLGTWKLAQVCLKYRVEKFILISTDKAVRPTNFMGASKRLAELILQSMAAQYPEFKCGIVRFGNVLGSSGSVVPLFKQQISEGGPITVTHPEVIRYFMTISEAAELVIQAGAMGDSANVFLLDMGQPVKIADLALEMVRLSGLQPITKDNPEGDIEIVYTGLRPGEKLFEELILGKESIGTQHPRILAAREKFKGWDELEPALVQLEQYVKHSNVEGIVELLEQMEIDFDQQYPISDPLFEKSSDQKKKVVAIKRNQTSPK
jgi:FlaA1/EpsC-like NDP-sugar epimerase